MKKIIWISANMFMVMLFGCSTTYNAVSTDYDRTVDFTKYATFAWLPDKADTANTVYNNEIIRNNIRNYFGLCMSDRGYTLNLENPDLLLQVVITNTKKEKAVSSNPSSYYFSPYYYGSYYYTPYSYNYYYRNYPAYGYGFSGYPGYANTQTKEYINGSITLNLIDLKENKLVWTGTAEGDIYDPSQISQDIHPAVHRILNEYPVKPLVSRKHKIR